MGDNEVTGATARPWSYDIQHGPSGEEIYAWVYYHNLMVCTVKVHHAKMIVEAVNAYEPLKARLAEVEEKLHYVNGVADLAMKHRDAAEARIAVLEKVLESIRQYGSDTLSGRVDGGIDDRQWQREAVREMTRRASVALAAIRQLPTTELVNPEKMYSYDSEAKVEFEK
jgi:hypothetical protein